MRWFELNETLPESPDSQKQLLNLFKEIDKSALLKFFKQDTNCERKTKFAVNLYQSIELTTSKTGPAILKKNPQIQAMRQRLVRIWE